MGANFFIFLLSITHVSVLVNPIVGVYQKKGFSMKLIHRDSKESPLYRGDHLTRDERIQILIQQSKSQARYIHSHTIIPESVRLPVVYEPSSFYVTMVGLGSFHGSRESFKNYYLIVDSGSEQTWLQCEGASKVFNQDRPLYPWRLSDTYHPVPCNTHPLCSGDKCNADGLCTYNVSYVTGSVTSGIVAEEKFTLGSNTSGFEIINLRMGCGFYQNNFETFFGRNHLLGKPNLIAGILGLGIGQWSFINQLGVAGQGKFSYCLETFNDKIQGSDTYLRFGADATIGGIFQKVYTTPFVTPHFQTYQYYLNLEDISVGKKRVGFPRGTFGINSLGEGGTIIDSGAPISMMNINHFDKVADLVKAHFKDLGIEFIGTHKGFDVCFRLRGRFDITNYPSITLHFQQADYVIPDYKSNFMMMSTETICLGFLREDTNIPYFVLGAMQQANKRILYNVMDKSLSFATEYCELDS